jgi:hypothetical protein
MIPTPYLFESNMSDEEFQKIGQFAVRWSHIEHTIGNCLRRLLELSPKHATVVIFPLSLDMRMARIDHLSKLQPLAKEQQELFDELRPLIKAMQFLRNTALHGIIVDLGGDREPFFHLRSKDRVLTKEQLFGCEDIVNYTAHIAQAFRVSLGEKDVDRGRIGPLPDRPPIPDFLPNECRAFPKANKAEQQAQPKPSPA